MELNEKNEFIPTIWQVDINNMLFSKFQSDIIFLKNPKSYVGHVRLKEIDFLDFEGNSYYNQKE